MALESVSRHKRILGFQSKLCGIAFAIVLAFTGVGAAWDHHSIGDAQAAAHSNSKQVDFWKIVAGQESAHSVSSSNKLASELHTLIATDPDSIGDFQALANQYGGVDQELGMNPFDNAGLQCKICGTLNPVMLNNIQLIIDGNLDTVIGAKEVKVVDTTVNFTPLDLPNVIWFGFLYLGVTTAALVIAVRRDGKKNDYDPNLLNWAYDGGSAADPIKKISKALSPAYFLVVLPIKHKFGKDQDGLLRSMGIADQTKALRDAYNHLAELPLPSDPDLRDDLIFQRKTLQELLEDADDQTAQYSNVRLTQTSQREVERRLSDTKRIIAVNAPAIEARREALKEMEGRS